MEKRFETTKAEMRLDYDKSPQDSIDEILEALQKGNSRLRFDDNYLAMRKAATAIKDLQEKALVNADEQAKLKEQLGKLQNAAEAYLEKKVTEHRAYSENALNRISAARKSEFYAKATLGKMAENEISKNDVGYSQEYLTAKAAENNIQKTALDNVTEENLKKPGPEIKVYNKEDALKACQDSLKNYKNHPSLATFAEHATMRRVYMDLARAKNGNGLQSEVDIQKSIQKNTEAFEQLTQMDSDFANSVSSGTAFDDNALEKASDKLIRKKERLQNQQRQLENDLKTPELNALQMPGLHS